MTTTTALASGQGPEAGIRCSDWARAVALSPAGTCGSPAGYLLAEIPLPWPHDVAQTPEGTALSPLLRAHGCRLQAVIPAAPAVPAAPPARPPERRLILHARPPGGGGFAGYRRLEATAGDSLAETAAALFAAAADPRPSAFDAPAVDVLVCTHGTRDSCCGKRGAGLAVQLAESGLGAGQNLWRTSHMGGHRFAPTFLVLPEGTSWGFADLDLVTRVLRRDGEFTAVARHYRGCSGLGRPELQALEAAVLRQVGWPLLDAARDGDVDGPRARLWYRDGPRTHRYAGEVRPGRTLPVPGCLAPASPAGKSETEWVVTAVRRA